MEENVAAKAPVTRLRRRLSVEQSDEVKSPSAPSTPSKKRGGRLAAKPQLELIDENASENTPKKQSKKSAAMDVIEASEEKVLTPSRRSTRIKSNTSIVSDTQQSFDSPRAKRAARRNSQIGSDNEAPLTPVRQTKRTRKDSASSIDKQEDISSAKKISTIIADSIIEEVDSNSQKSIEKSEITPKRKSPRLQKMNKRAETDIEREDMRQKNNNTPDANKTNKNKISDDSFKLINSLDDRPVNKTQLNNSASSVNSRKNRRNRTNTWTAAQNDTSDIKKQNNLENENNSGNKDNQGTSSSNINDEVKEDNKDLLNSSKNKRNSVSSDNSKLEQVVLDKSSTGKINLNKTNDNSENIVLNETERLFEKPPVTAVQSLIYFDDSDSDSRGKPVCDKPGDNEDQCVPVIPEINQKSIHGSILNQNENESDKVSYNDTCEPMDIDETMPTNVSLINSSNSNQDKDSHEIFEKSKEKEVNSIKNIQSSNKSKRESTSSLSTSQNNDKTENENKSTLILSQLKDVSTTDSSLTKSPKATQLKDISTNDNSLTKSPKTAAELLSKSVTDINNKDKVIDKKDSLTYMTSTPLQQKNLKKMPIHINTSVINNSNNGSMQQSPAQEIKNNISNRSNKSAEVSSSEGSDSGNVSTKDKSDFLDDEAEETSDDYESGDSQDEQERQYAKENEILEKGDTLDSDDNGSNDTDYEKDSFVVSSDEEDNELLTGSGDDLSMSDNELTMSKKSKKKFDNRKSKEQKKASREMYAARHNISSNSSNTKQKKNKRQRLNSSTLQSEEEIAVRSKETKRMQIDSSQDQDSSNDNTEVAPKETNIDMSMAKEHEITSVCDDRVINKIDPLSMNVKTEPQTPLKDLNMSSVPSLDKIEEVEMDQNVTIMKSNETSDPLQEDSDVSSISENMEISSNYDSVLKELNKEMENRKIKRLDISLNLNKKTKQSAKNPIVDNLNLTNTKESKHNVNKDKISAQANIAQKLTSSSKKDNQNKGEFDESSSDSIDLQLLFSEDSSDSIKKVPESKQDQQNEPESFIPLKRTEARTNIPEDNTQRHQDKETCINHSQGALNNSTKKQKNKNSLSMSDDTRNITANPDESLNSILGTNSNNKKKNNISNDEIDISIDQKDSSQNISINTTLNNISKKKKKISISGDTSGIEHDNATNQHEEASQIQTVPDISMSNTLNTSTKKKKKKNSVTVSDETVDAKDSFNKNDQNVTQNEIDANQSMHTSTKKKKKENSICLSDKTGDATDDNTTNDNEQRIIRNEIDPNQSLNTSTKKKKKKNSLSVSDETESELVVSQMDHSISLNNTLNTSSKKKKKKLSITDQTPDESEENPTNAELESNVSSNKEDIPVNGSVNTSFKKKKKKNSISISEDLNAINDISSTTKISNISCNKSNLDVYINSALNASSKKKKKNSISCGIDSDNNVIESNTIQSGLSELNKSSNEFTASAKKKKKCSDSVVALNKLTSEAGDKKVNDSLTSSAKKKENTKAEDTGKVSRDDDNDAPEEIPYTSHKNTSVGDTSDGVHIFIDSEGNQDWNTLITSGGSKKKNKKQKEIQETPSAPEITDTNNEETGKSNKRKRKLSANSISQDAAIADLDHKTLNDSVYLENKRKKQKTSQSENIPADVKGTDKKQNKKRKERDDDDSAITSKVFKQNSSDKISVPRLPPIILNQLEDKPRKEVLEKRKAKVVSTTQFIVEEAQKRKNKPSNYLEESVYLDDSVDKKKQKGFIKIPKVLPFVPTATISGSGFTTKFQINVLAKETKFVAQTSNMAGFKNEYLSSKKIKKAGTYEMYKSQRNRKMSKF